MERIGILGGTFDPPHIGHLWLAEAALQALGLDKILFMPAGEPPHKEEQLLSPAEDRLAMTRLAVNGDERFEIDELDLNRPPPHYTSTLLPMLHQKYPGKSLWYLIGSDSLRDLPSWHQPTRIVKLCRLGLLPRPGIKVDWHALDQAVPGIKEMVDLIDAPTLNLSGTKIRQWISTGYSARYLVCQEVSYYLRQKKLYRRP